jgi:hypothetical protein
VRTIRWMDLAELAIAGPSDTDSRDERKTDAYDVHLTRVVKRKKLTTRGGMKGAAKSRSQSHQRIY